MDAVPAKSSRTSGEKITITYSKADADVKETSLRGMMKAREEINQEIPGTYSEEAKRAFEQGLNIPPDNAGMEASRIAASSHDPWQQQTPTGQNSADPWGKWIDSSGRLISQIRDDEANVTSAQTSEQRQLAVTLMENLAASTAARQETGEEMPPGYGTFASLMPARGPRGDLNQDGEVLD